MPDLIPLTQGKVAVVDSSDYWWLSQHKWYVTVSSHGYCYAVRKIPNTGAQRQRELRMHRYILDAPNGLFVDHVNGNGLDNRRCNLRLATRGENNANRRTPQRNNTSGFKGVSYKPKRKVWEAAIRYQWKLRWLGYFPTPESAAKAYDEAAIELFGEFACLNFPYERQVANATTH